MQAVLAGARRERSIIGSGMLLGCVYLALLKGGERFKMNTASKHTRMSPCFSWTIMLSKIHNGAHFMTHFFIIFCFAYVLIFCTFCGVFSKAQTQIETTWPLSGESNTHRQQTRISESILTSTNCKLCKLGSTQMLICQINIP